MMSRPVLKLREINPLLFNFVEELVEIRVGSLFKPLLSILYELHAAVSRPLAVASRFCCVDVLDSLE